MVFAASDLLDVERPGAARWQGKGVFFSVEAELALVVAAPDEDLRVLFHFNGYSGACAS